MVKFVVTPRIFSSPGCIRSWLYLGKYIGKIIREEKKKKKSSFPRVFVSYHATHMVTSGEVVEQEKVARLIFLQENSSQLVERS